MIPPLVALLGGMGLTCLAFAQMRGAAALSLSFVAGALLLPANAAIDFAGLPPIDKYRAIWLGALLGTLLFQPGCLTRLRWHAVDALVLATVVLAGYSSIKNGLGEWDAIAASGSVVLSSFLPYMLARIHFRQTSDLVHLGKTLFWGAVLYVPLAIWEFRMSPQLHNTAYGYAPFAWLQQVRWGYYRPAIFLGHGLAVGGFFAGCFLIGAVLYRTGELRWPLRLPVGLAVASVALGLALTMSIGPWIAVPLGWAVLKLAGRWRWAPIATGCIGLLWLVTVFTTGSNWRWMARPFEDVGAINRAASLEYRLDSMSEYAANIRERPWFGHGGWGRGRIENKATDSAALVYMLSNGFLGAGVRYMWLFCLVEATRRAARYGTSVAERQLILLYACLMGIGITAGILGVAAFVLPPTLIGGAAVGLVRDHKRDVRSVLVSA